MGDGSHNTAEWHSTDGYCVKLHSNRMLVLTCPSKLAILRKVLACSFPESLKAYGALHHVITDNQFKLEVLVDQWPAFSTVICRPSFKDMKDPSNHYMNSYTLFSKDPQNLCQMLEDPQAVNWNQDLEIQGCQSSLEGVLAEVSSKHRRQMHTSSVFLYMRDRMTDEELEKINSIRMLVLTCSSKLSALRRLLTHSFPESLKACGALHHVTIGNPFKLEVLVDQWPDFSTVICRPSLEDMKGPSDHYTNTYFLFSKDPQNLRQMLEDPHAVNWNQDLQINGCQPALGGVLQEVSSKHGWHMHTTSNFLYMMDRMRDEELEKINSIRDLQFSSLLPDEAPLVNAIWGFGGNDRSERYLRRCIQSFPTVCMRRGGVGEPLAWVMSEQSAEMRMGYTDKLYRGQGVFRTMIRKLTRNMESIGTPLYCHVAPDNKSSQAATLAAGFPMAGRWQQWNFKPL